MPSTKQLSDSKQSITIIDNNPEASGSSLYIVLPEQEARIITTIVQNSSFSITANATLQQLKSQGIGATIFKPLRDFLALVEQVRSETYLDTEGNMTIGIGLNIKNSDTKALFYELDPKRDWQFEKMQQIEHMPEPPLTPEEIDKLLLLTLTGVENKFGRFVGLTESLCSTLKNQTLNDTVFTGHKLIAMQSLIFNARTLIGKGFGSALQDMLKTQSDTQVLIEIIEESNRERIAGLQNRRLKEAGIFHGNPREVHTPWRQYQKLLQSSSNAFQLNAQPIFGLPVGQEEEQFIGGRTLIKIPGRSPETNNTLILGTFKEDKIAIQQGNEVGFLGNGDDVINIIGDGHHFIAGNAGFDIYNVSRVHCH